MNAIIAFLFLIILFPFLIFIGLIILLFERKNFLFIQDRLGKNKKTFRLYKLRTMKNGQITFIGSILRKTGVDEIPQLFNILKGNMNFIGPRPLTEFDVKRLEWDSDYYKPRWDVKPGLTGLAQLSPICHKKISYFYDQYYAKNKNLKLDMKILILSFLVIFVGKERVKRLLLKK